MYRSIKYYLLLLSLLILAGHSWAQLTISGTVFDSTKIIPVKNVTVQSSSGTIAKTDSFGRYNIVAKENDSLFFTYHNKTTPGFSVKQIENISSFDVSLHVRIYNNIRTLKEVRVYSKLYKQDSIENREEYAPAFNYQKPGIGIASSSYSGTAGLDIDEFIDIFHFRKNRMMRSLQTRLLEEEEEKYIDYRFNKVLVRRMTHLAGAQLDTFMIRYRPDYEFTQTSTIAEFYQYILNASYEFKKQLLIQEGKKD
ncbi:MAG: carboxypeptidase-like regulatory domain-containing protein [Ferruginibacter sp.]